MTEPESPEIGVPTERSNVAPVSEPVLSLDQVSKVYQRVEGGQSTAVADASFNVAEGEFVSLVGPSGCGKTTLLKVCAGLVDTTEGTISFDGRPGAVPPGAYGMVFQQASLMPWRTVLRNVTYPADILRLDRHRARERAMELLELVHLHGTEGQYPHELSGGMQQRVAIARGLLHDPRILFMDEPFGALDAMTREEMNLELQQVQLDQRKTVVFVTHSISEAILLSDKVEVMSSSPGRILTEIEIPLGRPRSFEDLQVPEVQSLMREIRQMLQHKKPQDKPEGASSVGSRK
jgi:NitT/TauT family transport system ATP-binding protein